MPVYADPGAIAARPVVRPWTVMVYMAAGDDADLDGHAVADLREMERGANDQVHVAVQIKRHWPELPQRYVISRGGRTSKVTPHLFPPGAHTNMGNGVTLAEFMTWALAECPAEHYMLVLWGHAYGLGFGREHGDPLRLSELADALDQFNDQRTRSAPAGVRGKPPQGRDGLLDILGTNACAMSYAEAAYELRDRAQYLLAAQIYVPFAGWPYDAVLQSISKTTSPEQLGRNVIDSYITGLNEPLTGERAQLSLLNLAHAGQLRKATADLAIAIRGAFRSDSLFDSGRRAAIRDAFIGAAAGDVRPLVDLKDLCRGLKRDLCDVPELAFLSAGSQTPRTQWLARSAEALKAQLGVLDGFVGPPFLAATAAHPSLSDLNGIGIYVPFVTDEQDLKRLGLEDDASRPAAQDPTRETSRQTYEKLALFAASDRGAARLEWPTLVYDGLSEPIPSELVDLITGVGVTRASDRAEITQIILSIEGAFNTLDRVLDTAKTVVTAAMRQAEATVQTQAPKGRPDPPRLAVLAAIAAPGNGDVKASSPFELRDPLLLAWFGRLESAIEGVERTTKRGLTQARFGLGPVVSPRGIQLGPPPPPKPGSGPGPREEPADVARLRRGFGANGLESPATPPGFADPAVLPVFRLFATAAEALQRLELVTAELERRAGTSLGKAVLNERALRLRQAFGVLCETATTARRVIRRVVANPAYGIGPSAVAFELDDREELANAAGLSSRELLLLAADPFAPAPQTNEPISHGQRSAYKPRDAAGSKPARGGNGKYHQPPGTSTAGDRRRPVRRS